MQHNRA